MDNIDQERTGFDRVNKRQLPAIVSLLSTLKVEPLIVTKADDDAEASVLFYIDIMTDREYFIEYHSDVREYSLEWLKLSTKDSGEVILTSKKLSDLTLAIKGVIA